MSGVDAADVAGVVVDCAAEDDIVTALDPEELLLLLCAASNAMSLLNVGGFFAVGDCDADAVLDEPVEESAVCNGVGLDPAPAAAMNF